MNVAQTTASRFPIVLDNFSLAENIVTYLTTVHSHQLPPPRVTVIMESAAGDVHLPGTSCGFFTTPVIHQALVDVRRTLSFLNLRYGYRQKCIEPYVDQKHANNTSILDLGLPSVTPTEFTALSQHVIGSAADPIVRDVLVYTDTQLAHFTQDDHQPDLLNVFKACRLMTEAILQFIYDRAVLPRPVIQGKS
jgi:hypothetical protein